MVSRVSFQDLYGRVNLQGLHEGPNISGVQISRDRPHTQCRMFGCTVNIMVSLRLIIIDNNNKIIYTQQYMRCRTMTVVAVDSYGMAELVLLLC